MGLPQSKSFAACLCFASLGHAATTGLVREKPPEPSQLQRPGKLTEFTLSVLMSNIDLEVRFIKNKQDGVFVYSLLVVSCT